MEKYMDTGLSAQERAEALADTLSVDEQAAQLKFDAPEIASAGLPPITGGTRLFTVSPEREPQQCFLRR